MVWQQPRILVVQKQPRMSHNDTCSPTQDSSPCYYFLTFHFPIPFVTSSIVVSACFCVSCKKKKKKKKSVSEQSIISSKMSSSGNSNLDSRSLLEELRSFDKETGLFDFGHPLLNRIADSFLKAAGIGAIQAASREAYFTAVEGAGLDANAGMPSEVTGAKKDRFPGLTGETNSKSLEAMVKNTGKESFQWGLAAGIYSGLTYGLKEARGVHDWKNSAVAGAITGATLGLTLEEPSHEQIVQCAITGAAISTAANLLNGIF